MTDPAEREKRVRDFYDARWAFDYETALSHLSDSFVFRFAGDPVASPFAGEVAGKIAFRAALAGIDGQYRITSARVVRVICNETHASAIWTAHIGHHLSDRWSDMEFADFFEFDEAGRIAGWLEFFDSTTAAWVQAGHPRIAGAIVGDMADAD